MVNRLKPELTNAILHIAFNKAAKKGSEIEIPDFNFKNRGSMAYIGSWEAVVDMTPVHQKATEGGHLAWFFWR